MSQERGSSKADPAPIDAGLRQIVTGIAQCRLCADRFASTPSQHQPRPVLQASSLAPICIAGQAPGTRVHASGRPFTDASGDRLRSWLGVDAATFYDPSCFAIVPMGFCFPGQDARGADLPPPTLCAQTWHAALFAQMPQIELFILVGAHAQRWHLGKRRGKSLTDTVAQWRQMMRHEGGPAMFPTPHPSWRNNAWLGRNPWFEAEALPALRGRVAGLLNSRRTERHA
ncbi:MAG: uracil-DNA glycosylase family protein [Neomegalonema sp.]|nr:uracil-DNA glycosylase family protein [Neomegalonema sp.]